MDSQERIRRWVLWSVVGGLLAVIVFATLSPMRFRPQTHHATLERFGAFALLGAAAGIARPRQPLSTAVTLVLIAAGLEALQLVAPGRHARVVDALVKSAGAISGVGFAWAATRLVKRAP